MLDAGEYLRLVCGDQCNFSAFKSFPVDWFSERILVRFQRFAVNAENESVEVIREFLLG